MRWETWNNTVIQEYENMILNLEACFYKLIALKRAACLGYFSSSIRMHFLLPMVPLFEDIQEDIANHLTNISTREETFYIFFYCATYIVHYQILTRIP